MVQLNIHQQTEGNKYPGKALIMVVDDEEFVLRITCLIISKMGYRPISFSRSLDALEYYKRHTAEIDLVLLDMIMPEMNGKDLFLAMKEINPEIKAILLSGWIQEEEDLNMDQWGLWEFLQKPIEKAILEESIRNALNNAPNTAFSNSKKS